MSAREILDRANEEREKGNPLLSLQLCDEASVDFQKEKYVAGVAESQAARFLALRHLFQKTGDKTYLILAKHAALSGAEVADSGGDKTALAVPYYNVAKTYYTLEDYPNALLWFQKAFDSIVNNPPTSHNRAGVVADFKIHVAISEYWNGDKEALKKFEEAVSELDASDEKTVSDYNYHVWKSGAFMEAARMLKKDNIDLAKEYLSKAKEIIDSDSRLSLRKNQWEKIAKELS